MAPVTRQEIRRCGGNVARRDGWRRQGGRAEASVAASAGSRGWSVVAEHANRERNQGTGGSGPAHPRAGQATADTESGRRQSSGRGGSRDARGPRLERRGCPSLLLTQGVGDRARVGGRSA